MNRNQWFVFGIVSILLSSFLFKTIWGLCSPSDDAFYISCIIQRYAFSVPEIIFQFLGWVFVICGFLESKKK